MRKFLLIPMALLSAVILAGCSSPAPSADYETVVWNVTSIDPADYGITQEMQDLRTEPNWSELTLAELCAYCLCTDGAGGELAGTVLAERFIEAPNTVLNYLAMLSNHPGAAEILCRKIAWCAPEADKLSQTLELFQGLYPSGRLSGILASLKSQQEAVINSH